MKQKTLLLIATLALLFTGCKQDDWVDWKLQNELWIEQNADAPGVQLSPTGSGLQYKVDFLGIDKDKKPGPTSTVYVRYELRLINGKVIDPMKTEWSSFYLPQTITGFAEGLKLMQKKAHYELYIPWELGYGDAENKNRPSSIPPYSTLIFDVTLEDVQN
ncbi:MAG: FKBP-type peptidyl-prolyl cis-trans isomerase [Bacteroidales bacterium]|nr:FKBP-type peptidyl-prolyl cis-trans isomerase [Bacteroidales bacterium]